MIRIKIRRAYHKPNDTHPTKLNFSVTGPLHGNDNNYYKQLHAKCNNVIITALNMPDDHLLEPARYDGKVYSRANHQQPEKHGTIGCDNRLTIE